MRFLPGHITITCKVKTECRKCISKRHPTLFHKEKTENNERHKDTGNRGYGNNQTKEEEKINDGMEVTTTQTKVAQAEDLPVSCSKIILLGILPVSCSKIILLGISHPSRLSIIVRAYALIDGQSNACMISPTLIHQLGLQSPKERYLLTTCMTC